MEPDQYRAFAMVVDGGSPEIYAETIFAGLAVIPLKHEGVFVLLPALARREGTNIFKIESAANAWPWFWFGGRHETIFSCGGGSIGNSFEDVNIISCEAADFAGAGFDDGLGIGGGDAVFGFCGGRGWLGS